MIWSSDSRNRDLGSYARLSAGWSQDDVAILHRPVISLQENRPRRAFIAVERPTRRPRDVLLRNNPVPVQHHRQQASHQRDVVRLPLTGLLPDRLVRRDEPVDRAERLGGRRADSGILDLHLVTTAQVNAAVAVSGITELDVP